MFRDFHIEALSEYIDSAITAVRVALMRITQGKKTREKKTPQKSKRSVVVFLLENKNKNNNNNIPTAEKKL